MSNPAATETKPAVETIRVKIDGRDYDVPKTMPDWQGKPQPTTMLQACKFADIRWFWRCNRRSIRLRKSPWGPMSGTEMGS